MGEEVGGGSARSDDISKSDDRPSISASASSAELMLRSSD